MLSSGGSSRQRNCDACVKSKRRCDKGLPACGRCVKQRYPCVYGGRRQTGAALTGDPAGAAFGLDCLADPIPDVGAFMSASNALSTMLGTDMGSMPGTVLQLNNEFSSLLTPMPGNNGFPTDSWPLQPLGTSSLSSGKTLVRKDYTKMGTICDEYAPWHLCDPSTKAAFSVGVLKNFHINFAHSNCTLYIHRHLYKDNMPRWMLQAFTMCLLYTNQTVLNRAVVLRVLHESVTDLKTTASSNTSLTPQLKLARVHALMFYQTIRMFDGDITLGSEAERDMALLESWNQDLCKVRDNLDDLADKGKAISEHPPESWERWVFAESLRRTFITCFSIQKFWGVLRHSLKVADIGDWGSPVLRWTLSRLTTFHHLWNAQNSFDFFQAWREKPVYIISGFSFEDFLKTGTGDDLDDFAIYILTVFFGVNEIKTFCHETSGRILTPI